MSPARTHWLTAESMTVCCRSSHTSTRRCFSSSTLLTRHFRPGLLAAAHDSSDIVVDGVQEIFDDKAFDEPPKEETEQAFEKQDFETPEQAEETTQAGGQEPENTETAEDAQ